MKKEREQERKKERKKNKKKEKKEYLVILPILFECDIRQDTRNWAVVHWRNTRYADYARG